MNRYYKYGLVFILVLAIIVLLYFLIKTETSEEIKTYLINMGYREDMYDRTLLSKMESNTTINSFSVADYTFNQQIHEYSSNVESMLNETYDFKNHEFYYNYRVQYSDNINVIFKGDYNSGVFSCNKEFSTASLSSNDITNTCNLLKIKVERFYNEAQVLFNNYHFIEYMESVKIE